MSDHSFERVEHDEGGYVLRCRCGWRSRPNLSAAVIGVEWDRHRTEVAGQQR